MTMKAATFQNWVLTTNLLRFPASFKYYLFPQMINLSLDALSLCILGKLPKVPHGHLLLQEQRPCLTNWAILNNENIKKNKNPHIN